MPNEIVYEFGAISVFGVLVWLSISSSRMGRTVIWCGMNSLCKFLMQEHYMVTGGSELLMETKQLNEVRFLDRIIPDGVILETKHRL
jgi:hypothetical protein